MKSNSQEATEASRMHRELWSGIRFAMPTGSRHPVTGRLMDSARGLILKVDGGGLYALDVDPNARKLLGARVNVDGTRCGYDRLDFDWIGPA